MSSQSALVVKSFYYAAYFFGIPGLIGTLLFGFAVLRLSTLDPQSSVSSDMLLESLLFMGRFIGWLASVFGGLITFVAKLLAGISLGSLLLGVLLYFTARSLAVNAIWARTVGVAILSIFFLAGLLGALSSGGGIIRLIGMGLAGGSGFAIYTLWKGLV